MAWPDRGYTDSYIDWGSPREWQFHLRDPCYDDDDEPRFRFLFPLWLLKIGAHQFLFAVLKMKTLLYKLCDHLSKEEQCFSN